MQRKQESLNKHVNSMLFQDVYGILELSANAMLSRKSKSLKLMQRVHSVLTVLRKLWTNNSVIFFESILTDPMDLMQEIICRKRFENEERMYGIS